MAPIKDELLVHYGNGAAMHETALNPAWIRLIVIALFLIIPQLLRAMKTSKSSKPPLPTAPAQGAQLREGLRDVLRQAAEQARARRSQQSGAGEFHEGSLQIEPPEFEPQRFQQPQFQQPLPLPQFEQPPTTEPESSFVPALLLLALLACLCLMAYRYWAG